MLYSQPLYQFAVIRDREAIVRDRTERDQKRMRFEFLVIFRSVSKLTLRVCGEFPCRQIKIMGAAMVIDGYELTL